MTWQSSNDVPQDSLIPSFPETVRTRLTNSPGTDGATRLVTGEIHALSSKDLAEALDLFLRTLTEKAALTDAVLETSAVRLASPRAMQGTLVCAMAHELWEAGFRVTFGPSWEPFLDGDLALGAAGDNSFLEDFVLNSESWEMTSRHA